MQRANWILVVMAFAVVLGGCSNGDDGNPPSQRSVVKEYKLPTPSTIIPAAEWRGMTTVDGRTLLLREERIVINPANFSKPGIQATYEVLRSDDDISWELAFSGQDNERFLRIDFLTKDHGWMARITTYGHPFQSSHLFETTDGGKTWTQSNVSAPGEVYVIRFNAQGAPNLWLSNPMMNGYIDGAQWDGQQWNQLWSPLSFAPGAATNPPSTLRNIGAWSDLGLDDDIVLSEEVNFNRSFFSADGITWHTFLNETPMPQGIFRSDDEIIRYGKSTAGLPLALGKRGMVVPGNLYILYRDLHRTLGGLSPKYDPVNSGFIYKGNIWIATKDGEIFYSPEDGRTWELLYTFPKPQGKDASFIFARDDKTLSIFERSGEKLVRHGF